MSFAAVVVLHTTTTAAFSRVSVCAIPNRLTVLLVANTSFIAPTPAREHFALSLSDSL